MVRAANELHDKTTPRNQLWKTDFTYLKVIGWAWHHVSTILDDVSRYAVAWKLCATMRTEDGTETLELSLATSGCDRPAVLYLPGAF